MAAYYLKITNSSLEQYLEYISSNNINFVQTQSYFLNEIGHYNKTRYNIITLSLEHLIESNDDFRDILLFISLLNSQNIPKDLLDQYKTSTVVDKLIFNLKKYSLITDESISTLGPVFSIHRSTKAIMLSYLTQKLSLSNNKGLLSQVVNIMETYLNESLDKENFNPQLLLTHYETFLSQNDLLTDTTRGTITYLLGAIYHYFGKNGSRTQKLLEESLISLNKDYSTNILRIAKTLSILGTMYKCYYDKKAKDLLKESITIYKKHAPNNIEIAGAMGYLGNIYRILGNYIMAKDLLKESIAIYKKHAPNNVGIARTRTYIGALYRDLGQYEKSKYFLEESLSISNKFPYSINNMVSLIFLGHIYGILGDYKKANGALEESLNYIEKLNIFDSVYNGWILSHLAIICNALGDYEKSKELLEKSYQIYKKICNTEDHADIAWVLMNLGNTYTQMGKYDEAKDLLGKSYIIYKEKYGDNHIQTSKVLNLLGKTYLLEGKNIENARIYFSNSLKILKTAKHTEAYMISENLAALYIKKAEIELNKNNTQKSSQLKQQAIKYLDKALSIVKTNFPDNSPHFLRIQSKLNKLKENV